MPQEIFLILAIATAFAALVGLAVYRLGDLGGGKKKQPLAPLLRPDLDELLMIADDPRASLKALNEATDLLLRHYGTFGAQPAKELQFVYLIARHKSSNAKLILRLGKTLRRSNPEFAREIEQVEKKGLDSR